MLSKLRTKPRWRLDVLAARYVVFRITKFVSSFNSQLQTIVFLRRLQSPFFSSVLLWSVIGTGGLNSYRYNPWDNCFYLCELMSTRVFAGFFRGLIDWRFVLAGRSCQSWASTHALTSELYSGWPQRGGHRMLIEADKLPLVSLDWLSVGAHVNFFLCCVCLREREERYQIQRLREKWGQSE